MCSIWYWKTQQCYNIFPYSTTGWHNPIQSPDSLFVNIDKVLLKAYGNKPRVVSYICSTSIWKWKQKAHEFKASLGHIVISCLKKKKKICRTREMAQWVLPAKPGDWVPSLEPTLGKERPGPTTLSPDHMSAWWHAFIHTGTREINQDM